MQRSRDRSVEQAQVIVAAAQRLLRRQDPKFTTQELAKEAGVALQTFYRYFSGKDELLLAVLEEEILAGCASLREGAAGMSEPLERLEFYVTGTIMALDTDNTSGIQFMTAEHYRLHQIFPDDLAVASGHFAGLLLPEIEAATEAGLLSPPNGVEADAWLVTELAYSTFHYYSFASRQEPTAAIAQRLWRFCLAALGGKLEG